MQGWITNWKESRELEDHCLWQHRVNFTAGDAEGVASKEPTRLYIRLLSSKKINSEHDQTYGLEMQKA